MYPLSIGISQEVESRKEAQARKKKETPTNPDKPKMAVGESKPMVPFG